MGSFLVHPLPKLELLQHPHASLQLLYFFFLELPVALVVSRPLGLCSHREPNRRPRLLFFPGCRVLDQEFFVRSTYISSGELLLEIGARRNLESSAGEGTSVHCRALPALVGLAPVAPVEPDGRALSHRLDSALGLVSFNFVSPFVVIIL